MTTTPITQDRRTTKALSIVARGDIHEVRPGLFRVRDISTTGTWHETTVHGCSCADFARTGLRCKHQIAVAPQPTGPVCPDCGSATKPEMVWCGKSGYRKLGLCVRNPEHRGVRV